MFGILSTIATRDQELATELVELAVELATLVGFCDGELSSDERMALGILAGGMAGALLGLADPMDVLSGKTSALRKRSDQLVFRIEQKGLKKTAGKVLRRAKKRLRRVEADERDAVRLVLLNEAVSLVTADRRISPTETAFVTSVLAPGLGVAEAVAAEVLAEKSHQVARRQRTVELAFVLYLLVVDAGPPLPPVSLPPAMRGFGAGELVKLITKHRLGWYNGVSVFVGLVGGLSFLSDLPHCGKRLVEWAKAARAGDRDVATRLTAICNELEVLSDDENDAFADVWSDLSTVWMMVKYLKDGHRDFLRETLAPALHVDLNAVLQLAESLRSIDPTLYRNLTGTQA